MRGNKYWEQRYEQLNEALMDKGAAYAHNLEKQFNTAIKSTEKDLSKWYSRLAVNNEISLQEAKRMLTTNELEEFRWDVEDYIKYGRENELNQKWIKQLENASARWHISRLEAMKIQMQNHVEALYGSQEDDITELMTDIYTEGYYRSIFEVQKGFGIGANFARLDDKQIEKVLSRPWAADGSNFSDRIWKQKAQLVTELNNQLSQMIIRGQAPDKAIAAIAKRFEVSKNQSGRLVMTEAAYFASESRLDSLKTLGVKEYEIVATLDRRTSEVCQALDGEHFPLSEYKAGVTAPPFHVWCRTTTVPYFDDEDEFEQDMERAARDSDDGKTYRVPASVKYPEWYKKHVAKQSPSGRIKLENVVGSADHAKVMEDLLKNAPEKERRAFEHYQSQFKAHKEIDANEAAFFDESKEVVNINMDKVSMGDTFNAKYQVAFHEYGHNIDWLMGKEYGSGRYYSKSYKNGLFVQTMNEEADYMLKAFYKDNLDNFYPDIKPMDLYNSAANTGNAILENRALTLRRAIRKGEASLSDMLNDDEIFDAFYNEQMMFDRKKVSKEFAKLIKDSHTPNEIIDLSDMLEWRLDVERPLGMGHGLDYWEDKFLGIIYDEKLATEAFAEMYAATITNKESLDTIKRFFPKSYDVFQEMLEVIQ